MLVQYKIKPTADGISVKSNLRNGNQNNQSQGPHPMTRYLFYLKRKESRWKGKHPVRQSLCFVNYWTAFLFWQVLFPHNIFLYRLIEVRLCFHKDSVRYNHNLPRNLPEATRDVLQR